MIATTILAGVLGGAVTLCSTATYAASSDRPLRINTIDSSVEDASILFGAHKFMRSGDGKLTGTFIKRVGEEDHLMLVRSKDGGATWTDMSPELEHHSNCYRISPFAERQCDHK